MTAWSPRAKSVRRSSRRTIINNAFDSITYEKGASVIGMFENWMGPEAFRKGVTELSEAVCVSRHYRGRVSRLSQHFQQTQRHHVVLDFPEPGGGPVVSVALECNAGKAALKLRQSRFLPLGSKGDEKKTWNIPLCVRYGTGVTGQSQCMLMTQPARDR